MADKKNEVAEKKSAEIIAFDPTMFEDDAGMGMENMGQEDLALPFLKILSGLDPLLDTMRQPVRVTYTIPSQEPFTAARRASRSFRVHISVGSSNGPLEALERAARQLSMLRASRSQKLSVLRKIIKSMCRTDQVSISKKLISTL